MDITVKGLYFSYNDKTVLEDISFSIQDSMPQSYWPNFDYSVIDIVLMGTTSQFSIVSVPGRQQVEAAEKALSQLGILGLKDRNYKKLSGGERQLVLIARALAQKAKILIMDEPTANLDYGNQVRVLEKVKELSQNGYIVIQSTHNPDQTFIYADKVLAKYFVL